MIKVKPGPLSTAKPEKGMTKSITLFGSEVSKIEKVMKKHGLNFSEAIRFVINKAKCS